MLPRSHELIFGEKKFVFPDNTGNIQFQCNFLGRSSFPNTAKKEMVVGAVKNMAFGGKNPWSSIALTQGVAHTARPKLRAIDKCVSLQIKLHLKCSGIKQLKYL